MLSGFVSVILQGPGRQAEPAAAVKSADLNLRICHDLFRYFFHLPGLDIKLSFKKINGTESPDSGLVSLFSSVT